MAPNRDASVEPDGETDSPEVAVVEQPKGKFFPTSLDLGRARKAAGKIRPNNPDSINAFLEVADALRAERDLA
jgi:hypothetical protein